MWRKGSVQERFWMSVRKSEGCWEWTASVSHGYGRISSEVMRSDGAHRVSWRMHNGPIPEGLCVLHKCDNRRCVRPDHLFLGTKQDNVDDMMRKGRHRPSTCRGMDAPGAKLTDADVAAIRGEYKGSNRGKLAARYGVRGETIWMIATKRTWRHI